MNYSEILIYLKQISARGLKLGLDRVRELANRLNNPQNKVNIIHIAGTNGKGSVGAMLTSILKHAGYQTGHFASPALLSVHDYFRINGKCVSDSLLAEMMTEVIFHAEQMSDKPTEFEILAVTAYLIFARQHCEFAVIECCMGGDADCTNIIDNPVLSIITNIQKDHCAWLGNSLTEIAGHKAGIIKYHCPVLTGTKNAEAFHVISEQAKKLHSEIYFAENLLQSSKFALDGTELFFKEFGNLHLSLLGVYQPENANLVLHAVKILRKSGIVIANKAVQNGLADCRWHGRFELFHKKPDIIFDGAHNPDGMKYLTQSLAEYFPRKSIVIMGVMADKDYSGYAELLKDYVSSVFAVRPHHSRSLDPEILKHVLQRKIPDVAVCDSVEQALRKACQNASQIICLGSLYLYQEFYHAVKHAEKSGWL